VKHHDNLYMEGQIETAKTEWATKGERAEAVRHLDNLKVEGDFQGESGFQFLD
jgi:hypothetical protein